MNIKGIHVKSNTGHASLTHWGRVTHICVSKLTIIGSNNGLSPDRRQAIIWINAGILLIQTLGTNFSEIISEINTFSFKKMYSKMSFGKCRPSCLGLNVLNMDTYVWPEKWLLEFALNNNWINMNSTGDNHIQEYNWAFVFSSVNSLWPGRF